MLFALYPTTRTKRNGKAVSAIVMPWGDEGEAT